eukprot:TRINITY_DN21732_c0_g1_i1.p1 TRINITY_DN21732_c0_g1~~TRINITY_DN21732_c0_g1_i1.p1  ORF type:complete len:794 (-),score=171.87 TRINITY_DN21732_c0_g1_i1:630-3011(-)
MSPTAYSPGGEMNGENMEFLERRSMAIEISDVYKSYGRGSRKTDVLRDFQMNIPRGHIYGLLGPSGCGKTTLLQCIVGKKIIDSGSIMVFGGKPGSRQAGVPGPRVGYMPQELALYGEFTIRETLQYFGRIFNMTDDKINERSDFLIQFLDLPSKWRLVMNLSGGQQRRASLAVALLHEPELLILDEPTVGVDPLLRQIIWSHLIKISRTTTTTIVITTHYVEEARQAHRVGMMRNGRLLAEDSPASLIESYKQSSLEDVFLSLCMNNGDIDNKSSRASPDNLDEVVADQTDGKIAETAGTSSVQNIVSNEEGAAIESVEIKNRTIDHPEVKVTNAFEDNSSGPCYNVLKWHRLKAILVKSFIRMWRNLGFLVFQFIIPTVQVSLFCLAIGRDPVGMTVAVVNEEVYGSSCQSFSEDCIISGPNTKDMDMDSFSDSGWEDDDMFSDNQPNVKQNFSCRFLSHLDTKVIRPVFFDNYEEAYKSVQRAEHWGVIHILENYTESLRNRLTGMGDLAMAQFTGLSSDTRVDNTTVYNSTIHVYLDMTNQQVGFTIQMRLAEAFQAFSSSVLSSCKIPDTVTSLPIQFETPVYGSNEPTFTEFMAPGVILSITYFMAVGLTSISFIIERKEGLLDRSWIAGVTTLEVMFAHVVAQFVVMVVQVGFVLIFMILVFEVPAEGPMIWVITLTILQGLCGMAFGLLVSALCDNEQDAIQLALGSFYPNLLLSGIIWPLEGMPDTLRYISYVLPQTFACQALRGIMSRGWGLEWLPVYRGFLVTIAWIVGLLALSAIILRVRR